MRTARPARPPLAPSSPRFSLAVVAALAAGCQLGDGSDPLPIGADRRGILGGEVDLAGEFAEVCAMHVVLPPDDDGVQDEIDCTCAVIDARMVLTAASCVAANHAAGALADVQVFVGDPVASARAFAVETAEVQRYFDAGRPGVDDLALLRLTDDPLVEIPGLVPAALGERPLTADDAGLPVRIVGFGETADRAGDSGARRIVETPIVSVEDGNLVAGEPEATTCAGDGGAPVYADFGAGPVVIAVTALQDDCDPRARRGRVDIALAEFVHPYLDRFTGPCPLDGACVEAGCRSPDPDCDACLWDGQCAQDCPTRDLDCPIGVFAGSPCTASGQCERGGRCVAAADDDAFLYCTQACDPARATPCPLNMLCEDLGAALGGTQCVFADSSLQGAACETGATCRSGICEGRLCANPCDASDPAACPDGLVCAASASAPGNDVCLDPLRRGGGGFCAVGLAVSGGAGRGAGTLALLALGLALLAWRRRDRRSHAG